MTNKNRLMPHTDQKRRRELLLYLSLLQSYMYRATFILNSEHEVLDKSHVVDVFSAANT